MLALVPVWLLSLAVFWVPTHIVWRVDFWLFAVVHLASVVVMFWRPLQTVLVMRMLGASRATYDEAARLEPAWRSVAHQLGIKPKRYALAVLPSDELNAFACGGSLLVVTSYAIETLPRDEMTGVLAHELAHHLGFHTVALTVRQWLSLPIFLLAQIGFFLQNVATAATRSFVSHSSALSAIGRLISGLLNAVAWGSSPRSSSATASPVAPSAAPSSMPIGAPSRWGSGPSWRQRCDASMPQTAMAAPTTLRTGP